MLRVRCQAQATLDAKGRLALPAALRRALTDRGLSSLVLSHNQGAVWAWTPEDFEEQVERPLAGCDPFDPEVMDFVDAVLAPAQDVAIDGHGRIRIPVLLRELAGLGRDVVVNSVMSRLEIWDRNTWEARFGEALSRVRGTPGMPKSSR